jgi:hypothetical protein
MMHRWVIASLFIAGTASAQAPGDYYGPAPSDDGAGAPGNVAPVAANPCGYGCGAARDVMQMRWAIGLSVGSMGLAQDGTTDAPTQFGVGQLSLRYRAARHVELELALGGGNEKLMDGSDGDRQIQTASLGLRYRFAPDQNWNWWIMGALGAVTIASQYASDQERQDSQRPMGELGLGLERRFEHFALQAEVRAAGTGETRAEQNGYAMPVSGTVGTGMVGTPKDPGYYQPVRDTLSGGTFTIGASYYF